MKNNIIHKLKVALLLSGPVIFATVFLLTFNLLSDNEYFYAVLMILPCAFASEFLIKLKKKHFPNAIYYPEDISNLLNFIYIGVPLIAVYIFQILISAYLMRFLVIFGILIPLFSFQLLFTFLFLCQGVAIRRKVKTAFFKNDDISNAWLLSGTRPPRNQDFLQRCVSIILKNRQKEIVRSTKEDISNKNLVHLYSYLFQRNQTIRNDPIFSESVSVDAAQVEKLAHIYTFFISAELLGINEFEPQTNNPWAWYTNSPTVDHTCCSCITYLYQVGIIPKSIDSADAIDYLKRFYSMDLSELLTKI